MWRTLGDGEGQGGLVCCSPWGCRIRHDLVTEQLDSGSPGSWHQHGLLWRTIFLVHRWEFLPSPLCCTWWERLGPLEFSLSGTDPIHGSSTHMISSPPESHHLECWVSNAWVWEGHKYSDHCRSSSVISGLNNRARGISLSVLFTHCIQWGQFLFLLRWKLRWPHDP